MTECRTAGAARASPSGGRLVGRSVPMGHAQCAQSLRDNLVANRESLGRMARVSHEIGQRIMAVA